MYENHPKVGGTKIPLVAVRDLGDSLIVMSTAMAPQFGEVQRTLNRVISDCDAARGKNTGAVVIRGPRYWMCWVRLWLAAKESRRVATRLEDSRKKLIQARRAIKGYRTLPKEIDHLRAETDELRDILSKSMDIDILVPDFPRQVKHLRESARMMLECCDTLDALFPRAPAPAMQSQAAGELLDFETFANGVLGVGDWRSG